MGCGASKNATPKAATLPQRSLEHKPSILYQSKELLSTRESSALASPQSRRSAVFDTSSIGTKTRHGIAPLPGRRGAKAKINQDRGLVCWPFNGTCSQALFCVFDGHGRGGELVSEYCMKTLPGLLEADLESLKRNTRSVMSAQIVTLDSQLDYLDDPNIAMQAGSTATVVYLNGNSCWAACTGDSRAVLGSRKGGRICAKDMTKDHKPDDPDEMSRIHSFGGQVTPGSENGNPARVWGAGGTCGLAMSRSIGDKCLRMYGVIPDPECQHFQLQPCESKEADGDLCIIVASDGIWEFIEGQEACEIVLGDGSGAVDATEACGRLVRAAQQRWREEEGTYRDDITCVVALLPFLDLDNDGEDEEGGMDEQGLVELNVGATGVVASRKSNEEHPPMSIEERLNQGKPDFVARRLSVNELDVHEDDPMDEDWDEDEDVMK